MKILKEGWSLVAMILSLLFLPQENWKFWFADRPEDWYGELRITDDDTDFLIIKNAGKDDVNLNLSDSVEMTVMGIANKSRLFMQKHDRIPQESYSVVRLQGGATTKEPSKRAFASKGKIFQPRKLYILTEAEDDVSILLLFIGSFLVAALSFSIGFFCYQGAPLLPSDN